MDDRNAPHTRGAEGGVGALDARALRRFAREHPGWTAFFLVALLVIGLQIAESALGAGTAGTPVPGTAAPAAAAAPAPSPEPAPTPVPQQVTATPGALVPLDAWERTMEQLAGARERAARAEAEAAFLRGRVDELRAELGELRAQLARTGGDRAREAASPGPTPPAPTAQPPEAPPSDRSSAAPGEGSVRRGRRGVGSVHDPVPGAPRRGATPSGEAQCCGG